MKYTKQNNKHRKNLKNKKTKTKIIINRNQSGGVNPEFVASGSYGCVYRPPLSCQTRSGICQPEDPDPRCKGISKLMTRENAKNEFDEVEVLDLLGFDTPEYKYHLKTPLICKLNRQKHPLSKLIPEEYEAADNENDRPNSFVGGANGNGNGNNNESNGNEDNIENFNDNFANDNDNDNYNENVILRKHVLYME
jgi:hypothetical protein